MTRRPLALTTLIALLVPAVLLAGCSGDAAADHGDRDSSSTSAGLSSETRFIDVVGPHVAFTAEVPLELGIVDALDTAECGIVRFELAEGYEEALVVEAVPVRGPSPVTSECTDLVRDNDKPGNGRHGTYRTLADVADPRDVETIETGLGEGTLFEQTYFECTNECGEWSEPVAIVTLAEPVDPAYPTLVVRGEKDAFSREQVEAVLDSLDEPRPTGS